MTNRADVDVLIVGAGPAGLTLANDLASRGVRFRVIDPLKEPERDSRAYGLGGRTLLALDTLGLVEPMLAASQRPAPVQREYVGGKLASELDFATVPRDPYPSLVAISQQRMVRVLATALRDLGREVEWSTRLVGFEQNGEGVVAQVDRGGTRSTIRAGWIVGCDGERSTVRKTLGVPFRGRSMDLQVITCECDLDWKLSRDIWWTWHDKDGFAGAVYNDFANKWHLEVLDLSDEQPSLERVASLLRQRSGIGDVQLRNPSWIQPVTFADLVADRFLVGRAALVGDAAHVFGSIAGQGLHFAIEDALNLGWKLGLTIAREASPSLLQTYESERRDRLEDATRKTRGIAKYLDSRGASARFAWAARYYVGKRFATFALASKQANKLVTDYAGSPLSSQESTPTSKARAGLHVPDGACRVGGSPARLLEILRSPEGNLLLFAGLRPSSRVNDALRAIERSVDRMGRPIRVHYVFASQALAREAGFRETDPRVIVDGLERLHGALGLTHAGVVYVRPDGYIGLHTRELTRRAVRAYLTRIHGVVELEAAVETRDLAPPRPELARGASYPPG